TRTKLRSEGVFTVVYLQEIVVFFSTKTLKVDADTAGARNTDREDIGFVVVIITRGFPMFTILKDA
ncbi:MAG: hypothetical protein RL160_1139, partial [Bacteroidota bacterium]